MSTIHLHRTTTSTSEQFLAALIDFGLGHTYTFTGRPDGTTGVDAVVVREGKNLKGRALGLVLGTVGKGVLERAFGNTIKAIEARQR